MDMRQVAEMGADMIGSQDGDGKRNGKNGNGAIRRVSMWLMAIVSIIVISVFISNLIGGVYRKDFRIEQVERELGTLCIQIKEIELKVKQMELIDMQFKTEMAQRLRGLEIRTEKIDTSIDMIKTDMAVIKEINRNVKKLTGN